jgi:hypothetical protein
LSSARLDLAYGSTLRAFASAGAAFFADNDWHSDASFEDAPADSFDSELPMPDTVARVGLGIEMTTYSSHAGMLRVGYMFQCLITAVSVRPQPCFEMPK